MFKLTSRFDRLFEKATSNLHLEPDWPVIMKICDLIRQGDVQPKYVVTSIKKKLESPNPHVAMFSLQVLESCVKNCGALIQEEVGTKESMEHLRETVKTTPHENVKNKILELLQTWAFAFRNKPKYRVIQDTVMIMKAEGYKFPTLKESDAMFLADTAPEWADGDCCHRCRTPFGVVQRKHHCRACGQVFCNQCSSKNCTLPKFGIEKEVRVCEACYDKVNKPSSSSKSDDLPVEYLKSSLAQQSQAPPPRKSDAELREEEELQLAIALSQSEAEQKSKTTRNSSAIPLTRTKSHSPPPTALSSSPETDPELARYLNRSYWQQHSVEQSSPSAPTSAPKQMISLQQNGVEEEMEEFVHALRSQVEIFVNRMKSNSSRGRSIANDSSVQTLFMNITAMHSKLLRYIQQQDDSRVYYEGLQDKLTQVKDARAALDALREEHKEKLRREAELAERQKQLQMAQKLDIMRKKKQEYLQYQRQLALQRIQEQEREMQMRQEQQKQQYLLGSYANLRFMQPGYDNQGGSGRYPAPPTSGYPPYQPGAPMPPSGPIMGMPSDFMGSLPRGMSQMMGPGQMMMTGHPMEQQPGLMGPPQMMPPGGGMGSQSAPIAPPMGQVMHLPPPGQGPIPGGMGTPQGIPPPNSHQMMQVGPPGGPMGQPTAAQGLPQAPPPQGIPGQVLPQAPPPQGIMPHPSQGLPQPSSLTHMPPQQQPMPPMPPVPQIGSPTMTPTQMIQQAPVMMQQQPPPPPQQEQDQTGELISFD